MDRRGWLIDQCESHGDSKFLQAVVRHLQEDTASALYESKEKAEAFEAFINGGGNVPLYEEAVRIAMGHVEQLRGGDEKLSIVDLGCGTGKLLLPLLERLKEKNTCVGRVVLMDKNRAMFDTLESQVRNIVGLECRIDLVENSFKDFCQREEYEEDVFDVAISSFALHYTVGEEREIALRWIAKHAAMFLLFEFDVRGLDDAPRDDQNRFKMLAAKFERGASEYGATKDLVVNHFLAPVFTLNFLGQDASLEQSKEAWEKHLLQSNKRVEVHHVFDYWWAPCVCLVAKSHSNFDVRPFVSDAMQVVEYAEKGKGYRARRAIARGEVVLIEDSLIVDLGNESERYNAIGCVLHAGVADSDPYDWILENSFKSGDETLIYAKKYIFNHSCWSNCGSFDGIKVHALRDVNIGEELCISYIEGLLHSNRTKALLMPNAKRKQALIEIFGFQCLCGRCAGTEALKVEQELEKLGKDISNTPMEACKTLEFDGLLPIYEQFMPPGFVATEKLRQMINKR